jgi:hypothetical protein
LEQTNAATTAATTAVADHNKCNSDDIITCTDNKETHRPAKDTIPFCQYHFPKKRKAAD